MADNNQNVCVQAPENSLAKPKAKLSMIGLIAAVLALVATGIGVAIYVLDLFQLFWYERGLLLDLVFTPGFGIAILGGWVVPLFAVIAVLTKKKGLAVAGLILAAVMIVLQLFMNVTAFLYETFLDSIYQKLVWNHAWEVKEIFNDIGLFRNTDLIHVAINLPYTFFALVNGARWLYLSLGSIIEMVIYGVGYSFKGLLITAVYQFSHFMYNVKNWLALVAFALVVFKKKAK